MKGPLASTRWTSRERRDRDHDQAWARRGRPLGNLSPARQGLGPQHLSDGLHGVRALAARRAAHHRARQLLAAEHFAGTCILDSVLSLNIFAEKDLTPLAPAYEEEYGAGVSGGSETLRYFLQGNYSGEQGVYKVPNSTSRASWRRTADLFPASSSGQTLLPARRSAPT